MSQRISGQLTHRHDQITHPLRRQPRPVPPRSRETADRGHDTVVVDLTGTRFCDTAGLHVLVRAHRQVAEGGELRLALPAEGAMARILTVTGLDRLIPSFGCVDQALAHRPAAAVLPPRPRLSQKSAAVPVSPAAPLKAGELAAQATLEASVAAGDSGPVIALAGEADLTTSGRLSALITRQLAGEAHQLTIDVSGLRFADVASIRVLVLAAITLKRRGGRLVLLCPQQPVARVLMLLGADQVITLGGIGTPAR